MCWNRTEACIDSCAAFRLDDDEVYCLALPVLGAQGIARVMLKKTLLDAHAENVEAAEKDEREETSPPDPLPPGCGYAKDLLVQFVCPFCAREVVIHREEIEQGTAMCPWCEGIFGKEK
jgi:predicted GNAT family acetyltransferase